MVTTLQHAIIDKLDNAGNVIWEKEYSINGIRIQQLKSIQKVYNGYIATGWLYDSTADKIYSAYLKIDISGNINANQILYDSLRKVYTYDINVMNNNKYVLCAHLITPNSYNVYSSAYIIDIRSGENKLKNIIYGTVQTSIICL